MEWNVEFTLGALLIIVYAHGRYNQPVHHRSSTTAARYFGSLIAYYGVGLGLYYLFSRYPDSLQSLLTNQPKDIQEFAKDLSAPLVVAVLLTVFLANIPVIAKLDKWVREQLQYMAAIPYEARRMSAELQRAEFHVPEPQREELSNKLQTKDITADDIVFESADNPQHLWTKVSSLSLSLEAWEQERRYAGFLATFSGDYKILKERYEKLLGKTKNYFDLMAQPAGDTEPNVVKFRDQVRVDFLDQGDRMYRSICDFISRGILQSLLTHESRMREIHLLGFTPPGRSALSVNQFLSMFLVLFFVVLFGLSVAGSQTLNFIQQIALVTLIATNYSLAVAFAVGPKERWKFAKRDEQGQRPGFFYLISGVLSVLAGLFVGAILKWISFQNFEAMLTDLEGTYPWYFMTFTTAIVTAFQVDNEPAKPDAADAAARKRLYQRLKETAGQAIITALAALFVVAYALPATTDEPSEIIRNVVVMAMSGVIGGVIGYFVPTWYREASKTPVPEERIQAEYTTYIRHD